MRAFFRGWLLLLLCLWLAPAGMGFSVNAAGEPVNSVLCILSYSADYQWTNDIMSGLRHDIQFSDQVRPFEIFELSANTQPGARPNPADINRLQYRLSNYQYDAIVVMGNPALELFLSEQLTASPEVPVVFAAYFVPPRMQGGKYPANMTGLTMPHVNRTNIKLAMSLFPELREIIILTNAAADGNAIEAELERARPELGFAGQVTVLGGDNISTEELLARLKALPPDTQAPGTLVIYNDWFSSLDSQQISRNTLQEELRAATLHIPVLVNADNTPVGLQFAVGGAIVAGQKLGMATGELLQQVLRGVPPSAIPVRPAEYEYWFDYPEMTLYHLSSSRLPAGSTVFNEPQSFYEKYARILVSGSIAAIGTLLGVLICVLVWQRWRTRNNRQLRAIFDASPARIMVVDADGKILFVRTGDQDVGRQALLELGSIHSDKYPELWNGIQQVLQDGKPLSIVYPGVLEMRRRADLRKLPADCFGREAVLMVSLDIEEMHRLQQEYRHIAEQTRLTLESIGDGVIVTDAEERITLLNGISEELTGYTLADAAGKKLDDIFNIVSYTNGERVESPLRRALATRQIMTLANHTDLIARDGTRRHIADSAAPIIDRDGTLTGAVLVFRDVTEEYDRRDRLHIQKAVLEKALTAGEMTFFRLDENQEFLQTADPAFWPCRDGKPLPIPEWVHAQDAPALLQDLRELALGARREFRRIYRVAGEAGLHYYEVMMFEDISPLSERKEFFGIIRNVTEFRERELNYRNTSALLRDVIDNMPGYVWVKDAEHGLRHLLVSRGVAALTGKQESELIGHVDADFLDAQISGLLGHADETALRDGRSESIITITDPAGVAHDLKIAETVLSRPDGSRLLLGIGVDISHELKMEKQLQEKNRLLEDIFDNLPLPLFIKDFYNQDRYLFASRTFADMLGIDKPTLMGQTDYDVMSRELAAQFVRDDAEAMARPDGLTVIEDMPLSSGKVARFQTRKLRLRRDSGNDLLLGIGVDITELAESRNELQQSNELLRAIMDNLPCALFVKDADNDFRYVMHNRVFTEAFALTGREIVGHSDPELLLPENARLCGASDRAAVASGEVADIHEEVILGDGKLHTLRCIKGTISREDGSRLLLGICMDITLEQQLLAELRIYGIQQKALNAALESILLSQDFPTAIQEVLRLIGEHAQADRAYIFTRDYDKQCIDNTFEWTAGGIEPEIDHLQNLPLSPAWEAALEGHEIIFSADVLNETECAAVVEARDILLPQQIQSLLIAGIWLDGVLWGFIGFDFVRQTIAYPEIAEKMLTASAHLIEIALVRKLRQQELERSEYEKKLIMDTIRTPIILYDRDMNLLRTNNAATRIALMNPEQAAAEHIPCNQVFCGEPTCPGLCPLREALSDHQEHSREMSIRGNDYLVTTNPILFDGKLAYILKTMLDITESNSIQRRLKQAVLDAENASKAKSYFLATMSHELRTPLNAVIGFSELLRNGSLPRHEQNDYLQSINFAGNALLKLINDILDLSKIEAGQTVISLERSDFAALGREIYSIFKLQAEEKKLQFTLECDPALPHLYIDTLRLRQILLNLTGNAMKFTRKGSVRLAVCFRPENEQSGQLIIQVIDTGIGISEEGKAKIFEPFVQDQPMRDQHAYQGTGLGLSISSRLAKQMGGEISLESELDRGSTFTVTLKDIKYEKDDLELAQPEAANVPTSSVSRQSLSLLLVDDVPMNLKVLAAMLAKLGVASRSAASGAEALQMLESWRPDMVLTDMWMPEMNGPELAEEIRKLPDTARIRIVAVTADTEARANFGAEQFDEIMLKPLTLEKLEKLLDSFLTGRQLQNSFYL